MKKILVFCFLASFFSCTQKEKKDQLIVKGEIRNAGTQKIYLEELFFIQKAPQILDTAELKNGSFELQGIAHEEGLYRARLDSGKQFFFINDIPEIAIIGDASDSTMAHDKIHSHANDLLYGFINWMEKSGKEIGEMNAILRDKLTMNPKDSSTQAYQQQMISKMNANVNYLQQFVDTVSDPVVGMFALGYMDNSDNRNAMLSLNSLMKRFPNHKALLELKEELNQAVSQQPSANTKPAIGAMAPDITMNDVDGKSFSLSSLRGKYVLVDFWASWCGPCREENPNVVKAYNKFKDKNFTILGVSLDKQKEEWLKAIKEDKLTWKHISDLKFWDSDAVNLYGIEGIPYNVLVDPEGKIVGMDMRGADLESKLASVLK